MRIYIFMASWTLTMEVHALPNIQKQLSSKLPFPQELYDIKKVKTSSYVSKEKNMSSYLILTYFGNQASRKREQFFF